MSKNPSNDVRTSETERVLHKNSQKVLTALEKEPFGLSIAQIANNTRLSVKTVRNVISGLNEVNEDGLGVFTIKGPQNSEKNPSGEPSLPIASSVSTRPATDALPHETAPENPQLPAAKPEEKEEPQMPSDEEIKTAESANATVEVAADPFEQYKSMVETVMVEKRSVSLNAKQLSGVLQDLFGLKNVQFFTEGQPITRLSIQLSDEVVL